VKHQQILETLVEQATADTAIVGFLLFGSVARGTQREDSDIDVVTVRGTDDAKAAIRNRVVDGIKVGNMTISLATLEHSVETVPYLLHPLIEARVLLDRDGTVGPLVDRLRAYFDGHPEIVDEWSAAYERLKEEKATYGYEKTTIVDVWNELERRHSGGRIRRRFFDAFYMTNPRILSLVKRLM
jgi:hypothetical protein